MPIRLSETRATTIALLSAVLLAPGSSHAQVADPNQASAPSTESTVAQSAPAPDAPAAPPVDAAQAAGPEFETAPAEQGAPAAEQGAPAAEQGAPAAPQSADPWAYLDAQSTSGASTATQATDLAALGIGDPGAAAPPFPWLDVYGFIDFTYWQPIMGKDNRWDFFIPNKSSFQVGNINLYVASQISETLRSLMEIRFTYLPNGRNRSGLESSTLGAPYESTQTFDYTDSQRPIKLGAIEIERVQLEYAPLEWLTFTVGQWLTPYGIWNVDHGSPTTLLGHRPYLVGSELIPERQTGLALQGKLQREENAVGYMLGVSNGRGPLDSYYDMDENKALTARLYFRHSAQSDDLTLGGSYYTGRYTDSQRSLGLEPSSDGSVAIDAADDIKTQYDEHTVAADIKWLHGGLQIYSEFALQIRRFTDAGRPRMQGLITIIEPATANALQADDRRYGAYLAGGYRFDWFGVMPVVQLDYFYLDDAVTPQVVALTAGLNVRPHPSVTLKVSYGQATFPDADKRGPGKDDLQVLESQVAWAF